MWTMQEYETDSGMVPQTITPQEPTPARYYSEGINSAQWQLSATDIHAEIEHDLRGEVLIGSEWKKDPNDSPWLNDHGIKRVMSVIRTYVNRNTFLSDLSEEKIDKMSLHCALELNDVLTSNFRAYGIQIDEVAILKLKIMDHIHL